MTKLELQRLAVALFRSVNQDSDATWESMTDEDRDDALQWARDAIAELLAIAGASPDDEWAPELWITSDGVPRSRLGDSS